jgi:hypothetical protein
MRGRGMMTNNRSVKGMFYCEGEVGRKGEEE